MIPCFQYRTCIKSQPLSHIRSDKIEFSHIFLNVSVTSNYKIQAYITCTYDCFPPYIPRGPLSPIRQKTTDTAAKSASKQFILA